MTHRVGGAAWTRVWASLTIALKSEAISTMSHEQRIDVVQQGY